MNRFGEKIRKLRLEKEMPLRTVGAFLDIDQALISKAERGIRKLSKEQVISLSEIFGIPPSELLVPWMADKVVYDLGDDDEMAKEALKVAEEEVAYRVFEKIDKKEIIKKISEILDKDSRIEKGWVFGSFARGDDNPESDIDILFQVKENVKFSIFDQLGIREQLIEALNREIDFVEHDTLREYMVDNIKKDLIQIYG